MALFDEILESRGLDGNSRQAFLNPIYAPHDPFLLPDIDRAVDRLLRAHKNGEKITIYGDYDIDGLTATTLLRDALIFLGFIDIETFIPNRFTEGFGLNISAIDDIAASGSTLIVTVDCGSQSLEEIKRANELGVDIIVTDHHVASATQPPAIAVVNPKRADSKYPFADLPGVGVAFKLVQALQTKLDGLDKGQEKWFLDLVALGTVCDVVSLTGENRANVYWGLKVLQKTKRPGLRALMKTAGVDPDAINSRTLGFVLGPRMNAAGRLETAQKSLDMLVSKDIEDSFEKAQYLDGLNKSRQTEQRRIMKEAVSMANDYANDPVLVLSNANWSHGIIGIVAAKLLEKYQKPVFLFQEMGEESKGSARSYGDFSAVEAIESVRDIIKKGGGHKLAAGVSLSTKEIANFRRRVNDLYISKQLSDQAKLLLPRADVTAKLSDVNDALIKLINKMEPFGHGNPQPILRTDNLMLTNFRTMGDNDQHIKLELSDGSHSMQFVAFNAPESFFISRDSRVSVWYQPDVNEWRGKCSIEGRILHIETSK